MNNIQGEFVCEDVRVLGGYPPGGVNRHTHFASCAEAFIAFERNHIGGAGII